MRCMKSWLRPGGTWRRAALGLALTAIVAGSMGLSCDADAQADFRQTATQAVGDGVKTIVNGLIDGLVTAITNAGDGPAGDVPAG